MENSTATPGLCSERNDLYQFPVEMTAKRKPSAKKNSKEPVEKRARGRPTDYREEYCEKVVKHASETGHSLTAFAGSIGVCRDTLAEWASKHPDFSVAMRAAKAARAAFLESVTDTITSAPQMTYRLLALKNCGEADWRESKDVNIGGQKDGVPVAVDATGKTDIDLALLLLNADAG